MTLKIVMLYLAVQLGKSLNTAREISTKNPRKNFMFSINNGKKQQYKKMLNDKLISALSDNFHMNSLLIKLTYRAATATMLLHQIKFHI